MLSPELSALPKAIRTAYVRNDSDRALIAHTLDIAPRELMEKNQALTNELNERRTAECQAEHALSLLATTLDSTGDGILVVTNDGRIEICNDKFMDLWRVPRSMVCQDATQLLQFVADQLYEPDVFLQRVARIVDADEESSSLLQFKDGRTFERYSQPRRIRGNKVGRVWSFRDVTKRHDAERRLAYLDNYDELTGLANRRLLKDRIEQAIVSAHRCDQRIAIALLGLDHIKTINENFGHGAGDELLKIAAHRLSTCVRGCDTVARLGGDEFAVILIEADTKGSGIDMPPEMASVLSPAPSIADALQKILSAVSKAAVLHGQEVDISCSVGISLYPQDGIDVSTLLRNANAAMFSAKQLGGNNYQFYTENLSARITEKLALQAKLRHALERDEFILHFQPQVDLSTGRIAGMEALIRWRHPELGMVPPARFIGLAEETGLIVPIGAWVLRTACQQNMAWQRAGLGTLRIAVNLSVRQFAQADLVQSIAAVLAETGLDARCLEIELTESLVMSDVERSIDILRRLKALGVQLSIDDFGTGYSSLSYLKRFPIDVLKIDQSFVRDITVDTENAAISRAIISMAHSLGIRVIAEGVETEAQCEFMRANMCDEIQGFFFSKGLPAQEVAVLLSEDRRLPDHLLHLSRGPRTLLLVDDEPNILAALKRLLRDANYRILTADSGQAGLDLLAHNEVDVIVSDQRMPGMTGVQFLRAAHEKYPDTIRITLSGHTELQSVIDAINEGAIYQFLTKPWDDAQLRVHIERAFRQKEMVDENQRLNREVRTSNRELARANRQLRELLELNAISPSLNHPEAKNDGHPISTACTLK